MGEEVEIPDVGKVTIAKVIDCKGMVCPKPQLMCKKAANEMQDGEVAEMLITNPASVEAVPSIIKKTGCTHLTTIKEGNLFKLYFRKGK
jgi:TusA-related sulfurtransferase